MNHEIDDEKLVAYGDGELGGAAATEVKAALLRDPVLRRRAEKLRNSSQALRGAFDELRDEPVPTRILDLLEDERTNSRIHRRVNVTQLAIAASLALVIGSLSGFWFAGSAPTADVASAWPGALKVASTGLLDTTPSGAVVKLDAGLELQPVLSFRDATGRICRQYVVADTDPSGKTADGVACRTSAGHWQLEFASLRDPATVSSAQGFAPASGGDAGAFNKLVDALIVDPITLEQERELIRSTWE